MNHQQFCSEYEQIRDKDAETAVWSQGKGQSNSYRLLKRIKNDTTGFFELKLEASLERGYITKEQYEELKNYRQHKISCQKEE